MYGYWWKPLIIVVPGSHANGRWLYPVHLNVYISMFKQWWHVKKYKIILLVLLQNPFISRDGYA